MGDKTGLSINDSNLVNILSGSSNLGDSYSLTKIIDRYYKIYFDYNERIKEFKTKLMGRFNSNYHLLFINMKIDNVKKLEDYTVSFNLSQEYPVKYSYEIIYSYDPRTSNFEIKYDTASLSDVEKSFLLRFSYILGYQANQSIFRELINNAVLFNQEYSFDCSVIPFRIKLKDSKVTIEYTNSNNVSEIFTINFDKKDISYTNLVEEEDFLSLFKYSLKEMLDSIFIETKTLPDDFRNYKSQIEVDFCQMYLFDRKESESKEEDIPNKEYYFIQGFNEYKKITGYKNINKYNGRLKFEFDDGSELAIPEHLILVINNNFSEDYCAHNFFEEKILGLKKKGE